MPRDAARLLTDAELQKIERAIEHEYKRAYSELYNKWWRYMESFKDREKPYLDKLDAAFRSGDGNAIGAAKRSYRRFLSNYTIQSEEYARMRDQIAAKLTDLDAAAYELVNHRLANVYALNYNYLAGQLPKAYAYGVINPDTIKNLMFKRLNLVKSRLWNKDRMNKEVLQGILQGESMQKIAKRFANVFGMNKASAIRNARTAVTYAENQGRLDGMFEAEKKGTVLMKVWTATHDNRTRDSHIEMDGVMVWPNEPFPNGLMCPGDESGEPAEVYNCFVAETNIASDSEIIRSYKHSYSGRIVSIETARGVKFSCTPNHPILTPCGWIAAETLNKGDNICVTLVSNEHLAGRNPDVDHVFPRIDAIHELADKFGCKRVGALRVNFHGDVPASDVEIVTHKRLLRDSGDASDGKLVNKFAFKCSNSAGAGFCSFAQHLLGIVRATASNMRRFCKTLPFFGGRFCHTGKHCVRPIADSNIGFPQDSVNDVSGDLQFGGENLNGLSGKIILDEIVNVNVVVSNCHVYNLQTQNGYYFVNAIIPQNGRRVNGNQYFAIAHNCRCAMGTRIVGFRDKYGQVHYV